MHIVIILSAALCFLCSIAVALLHHPIRIHLRRHEGVFRADFFFLFLRFPLHNSARPVDPKNFTRRKFRKKLAKIDENSKQNGHHILYENRPTEDIFHFFSRIVYYARLSVKLVSVFGSDKLPKIRIAVHECTLLLHTDDPANTAVLAVMLQNLLFGIASLIAPYFRISYPERDFYVAPAYFSASSLSFDVTVSLPAIHYLRVFGLLPPDDDRILEALEKQNQRTKRKRQTNVS